MFYTLLKVGLKNLWQRKVNAAAALLAFAGVMFIFTLMMSLAQGLDALSENDSSASLAVVIKAGAQGEGFSSFSRSDSQQIRDTLANQFSIDAVSQEIVSTFNLSADSISDTPPVVLRGITIASNPVRQVRLLSGEWFSTGSDGVVIGSKLAAHYPSLTIGSVISIGDRQWTVTGIFDAGSPFFNGEVWLDAGTMQTAFNRAGTIQTVYFPMTSPDQLRTIEQALDDKLSVAIDVMSGSDLIAKQMSQLRTFLDWIIGGLSFVMFVGLIFGGISIMESNFSFRQMQLNTFLAIGVNKLMIASALVCEGVIIGVIAGLLGVTVTALMFGGDTLSTAMPSGQLLIELNVTIQTWFAAAGIAAVLGFISALLPSLNVDYRSKM